MNDVVLDASAVLAFLQQESGWERVEGHLLESRCLLLAVNLAEVLSRLADWAVPLDEAEAHLRALSMEVVAFDGALPRATAALRPAGRALGLSLGDRACLALTRERNALALTADQAWQRLDPALGIAVEYIRDGMR